MERASERSTKNCCFIWNPEESVKRMSMMTCVELAVNFLSKAIAETVQEGTNRNDGVCFEKYLEELCKIEK